MPENILGLDIGIKTIKAILVNADFKGYEITAIRVIDIEKAGSVGNALSELFEDDHMKSGICITALPVNICSFRNLRIPFRNRSKITQTFGYELEPHIPYALNDVLIDYIIIDQSEQSEILATAVPRTQAEDMINLLGEHGIETSIIDIDAVAVASKLLRTGRVTGCGLFLDIGTQDTACILFSKGKILHIRHYSFGGDTLSTDPGAAMEADRAEGKEEATTEPIDESATVASISPALLSFFREVKQTLRILSLRGDLSGEPSKIFLTGGGACYEPLRKAMETFFQIPVETVDILTMDTIRMGKSVTNLWDPLVMNHALALATRETKRDSGFNFGSGESGLKRKYEKFKKDIRWIGAIVAATLLLFGTNLSLDYHYDRAHLRQLKQEITGIFKKTFPEARRIVDPVQQMRVKVMEVKKSAVATNRLGAGSTALNVLKEMAGLIPQSTDFHITNFTYDGNTVEVKGETDNFNTVDVISNELGKSPYFRNVKISSANLIKKGGRVGLDLRMELK